MDLKPIDAIYLRWISDGRSVADIAKIERQSIEGIQRQLDVIVRRLGVGSIADAVEKAKSLNII
ncbi:UNVERIFIED_ORG: DNA-binding CsgD family transcriptional regulator [Rhizobium etli]